MKQRNRLRIVLAVAALIGLTILTPRLFAQGGILQPNGSYTPESKPAASTARQALPGEATGLLKGASAAVEQLPADAVAAPDVDPSGVVRGQEMSMPALEQDTLSPASTGLSR